MRPVPPGPVRLFGTNGIREVVGERMTAAFVERVAGAIAATFAPGPPVVVGWDGRTTSPSFARIISGTLAAAGHSVVEVGLLPTPAIQYSVRPLGAQLAVIVTASHNPPEFNGIKCIAADGLELPREDEERIEAAVERQASADVPFDRVGEVRADEHGVERYLQGILSLVDAPAVRRRAFRVLLDCGNGASARTSPTLLRRLGCRTTTLNGQVDGTFPGHRSEPTEENLRETIRTAASLEIDLGVVHDGDADRAVFLDSDGRFVPGERMLAWLAQEFVRAAHGGVVVTPVTASQAVEDVVRAEGGEVVYTRVGSPSVTRAMQERGALFGGEENGGLIFPQLHLARDGAMTLATALDLLARRGVSLREALAGLPAYTLVKRKVPCPVALRPAAMDRMRAVLSAGATKVVTLDGIKAYRGGGWVLLRPSGTEPLFRVFAEAKEPEGAQRLADEVVGRLGAVVRELESGAAPDLPAAPRAKG